jgi:parallel beta-helix repeat protein
MKRLTFASAVILLALILTASLALPAMAETQTVTNANDAGPGSLRQAIVDAANGDTIRFNGDYQITLASTLAIDKDLTIDGGAHDITISGGKAVRVFKVFTDTHATFDSLTVAHGMDNSTECDDDPCGGGIKIESGAVVTLTNSTIFSNTVVGWHDDDPSANHHGLGGGIYNLGTLTVNDSTISDNAVPTWSYMDGPWFEEYSGSGGGIYNEGILTVNSSTLSDNFVGANGYGAGIFTMGTLTVNSSSFLDNLGSKGSNGIAIYNYAGDVSISGSNFSGNAGSCSGAIENSFGVMTVTASTISSNETYTIPGFSCEGGAGGITNRGGTMTISGSVISNNTNAESSGGGMANYEGAVAVVIDTTITSNTATGNGGAIYNLNTGILRVERSRIISNTATSTGGGIASGSTLDPSHLTLTDSLLANNTAEGRNGGGIAVMDSTAFTMTNCTLHGNSAQGTTEEGYGGGIYNADSTPMLVNNILWANTAASSGPQIYNASANVPTISYSDIQDSNGSGGSWDSALGADGGGNIDADPLFFDVTAGFLFLKENSPAVDVGDNGAVSSAKALGGRDRIINGVVDMGAYEYGPPIIMPLVFKN